MDPMFSPPLHVQRHQFVIDFVKRNKPQKVVDLGCSECSLLKKLKFHREIELLVGVDINGAQLKRKMHGLAPISTYYLQPTYDQLRIELYQGSVTQKDVRLRGFDLVTSIELALKVCLEYGYEVEFTGVGQAPPGQQERVGFCSQIGVFHRLGGRDVYNMLLGDDAEDVFSYTLLYSINYPSLRDNNILRRVLVSEVLYWAEKLKKRWIEAGELQTGERDDTYTPCQTEGRGEECLRASERCMEMEEKQTAACGAEMENPVEQCGRGVSEDKEREDEKLFWTNVQGQQESCKLHRYVSVPLAVLWSRCPKICALSGNLSNLRHFLMEAPEVKLSQDGWAVLVQDHDLEEEDHNYLEDSGYAEASQCSHSAEQEEAWGTNV
ncbi:small RNA 2'-O-methyltransferase isoform X3 [Siniperca chuatsi]|uniref:small RNA 2'-O-methyltransferase isoform X3 n=1 Tax=Siniperca chuatsi TaxID=119488 RepID=UPI001CE1DC04|nr:small RNA 2'-O-methyltransferase isoform X3 [Siniperca chuatsi]